MTELSREVRIAIIEAKIEQKEQQAYSVTLDADVAKDLNDDALYQAAAANLKRIKQAQDVLEKKLAAVQGEAEEPGT